MSFRVTELVVQVHAATKKTAPKPKKECGAASKCAKNSQKKPPKSPGCGANTGGQGTPSGPGGTCHGALSETTIEALRADLRRRLQPAAPALADDAR